MFVHVLPNDSADGGTVLHLAATAGHADACRRLMAAGADPWILDRAGQTPLHAACCAGHAQCVRALAFHALAEAGVEGEEAEEAAVRQLRDATAQGWLVDRFVG